MDLITATILLLAATSVAHGQWYWAKPPPGLLEAVKPSLDAVIAQMHSQQQENYAGFDAVVYYGECGDLRGLVLQTYGNQRYYKKLFNDEKRVRHFGVLYTLGQPLLDNSETGKIKPKKVDKTKGTVDYTMKIVPTPPGIFVTGQMFNVQDFRFTKRTTYADGAAYRVEHQIRAAVKMLLKKTVYGGIAYWITGIGALLLVPTGISAVVKELGIHRTAHSEEGVQMPRNGPITH